MLSAPAVKKAEQAINEATQAIKGLLQSRGWENEEQLDALRTILRQLERVTLDYTKLECRIYGFDLWRYLSDEAIKNEAWKDLEAERKEQERTRYKKSANAHCRALGLSIPYPEFE